MVAPWIPALEVDQDGTPLCCVTSGHARRVIGMAGVRPEKVKDGEVQSFKSKKKDNFQVQNHPQPELSSSQAAAM